MSYNRASIINSFIRQNGYKSYLEIGVFDGANFRRVQCARKVGVDPDPKSKATKRMTSDAYFARKHERFDLIFVDGLHHADQAQRDMENALNCLNSGGLVLCHDVLPKSEWEQEVPRLPKARDRWTGDVWKAFMRLRARPDLYMYSVEDDCNTGIGIIQCGAQAPIVVPESELTYANFVLNSSWWMNVRGITIAGNRITLS